MTKHVFAFYDIQHDAEHSTTYIVLENGHLKGYVLIYTGTDVPSIILECPIELARLLLEKTPENNFIMHISPRLLPAVQNRYPEEKHYIESWMLVNRNQAKFFRSSSVRKLQKNDASSLAHLLSSRKDRPRKMLKRYADWISKKPICGVFRDDELVSYAGSFIQLPQVWMIGGIYTKPKYRNKGYATLATSAITEEALENAEAAALFARSDNYSAIKVYEKIGYRKIGEKIWVDVGTGLRP